jgi:hypothetical protein
MSPEPQMYLRITLRGQQARRPVPPALDEYADVGWRKASDACSGGGNAALSLKQKGSIAALCGCEATDRAAFCPSSIAFAAAAGRRPPNIQLSLKSERFVQVGRKWQRRAN